jgi:uncharacterized CHY-type Zn-finger protein
VQARVEWAGKVCVALLSNHFLDEISSTIIRYVQVFIQGACCDKYYGCAECHDEVETHQFQFTKIMRFMCKGCRKCFDRDFQLFSSADRNCNSCGTCWLMPGVTPESKAYHESLEIIDSFLTGILEPTNDVFIPK